MSEASPVFLYLHIPKTGGSTLGDILYEQYNDGSGSKSAGGYLRAGVYYLPDGFIRGAGDACGEAELRAMSLPDVRAVLGHFYYGFHDHLPPPARYMTMLREPVQRVLSLYHHLRHYDQLPSDMTLERFVTGPYVHEACNDQVRRLAGMDAGRPCTEATLQVALANLREGIDFGGVTERFDASLLLAARLFGWHANLHYLPRLVNEARRQRPAPDAASVELVKTRNLFDIELYRCANELLDWRIAAEGVSFEEALQAFTKRNRELLAAHGPASTVS